MKNPSTLSACVLSIVGAYVAATCAAVVAILIWTLSLETIGAGLLVPLFAAPAIIGFAVASAWPRFHGWRRAIFLLLAVPLPLLLAFSALFPSQGARADGADEMAVALLLPLVAAEVAGFVSLEFFG